MNNLVATIIFVLLATSADDYSADDSSADDFSAMLFVVVAVIHL